MQEQIVAIKEIARDYASQVDDRNAALARKNQDWREIYTVARMNGAKAFATYVILAELIYEIKSQGDEQKYEALSVETRTRIGSWAYVEFANRGQLTFTRHFPLPGTQAPDAFYGYDWCKFLSQNPRRKVMSYHELMHLEARYEYLVKALT